MPRDKNGKEIKAEKKFEGVPGPGTYHFIGDFDFRDPKKPDDKSGKVATQWSFGIKPVVRTNNLDVPGVGNVEVDMAPMWMKSP